MATEVPNDAGSEFTTWQRAIAALSPGETPKFRPFKSKKFSSYEEMNAWKTQLLQQWLEDGCPKMAPPSQG
jgi:hypothetical protein